MVPSKAEDKIIERMLSGRAPIVITESKENVVDSSQEIARRQRLAEAEAERDLAVGSSQEIARRQRLAEAERDLANTLRAHTPTTDEANITLATPNKTVTTESTNVNSVGKDR